MSAFERGESVAEAEISLNLDKIEQCAIDSAGRLPLKA